MSICRCNAMRRRDFVCGGGAAMFGAIVATLIGDTKPVRAEAISARFPSAPAFSLFYNTISAPGLKLGALRHLSA
jgi:hypothetical protein